MVRVEGTWELTQIPLHSFPRVIQVRDVEGDMEEKKENNIDATAGGQKVKTTKRDAKE